nr:acetyl-CoA carboxylase carboxyltransferase beta [Zabelia dielsii]
MKELGFNLVLLKFEHRCGLSKSTGSARPGENNSEDEYPNHLDSDIHLHNTCETDLNDDGTFRDVSEDSYNTDCVIENKICKGNDGSSIWNNKKRGYSIWSCDESDFSSSVCGESKNSSKMEHFGIITSTNDCDLESETEEDLTQIESETEEDLTQIESETEEDLTQIESETEEDLTQIKSTIEQDFTPSYKHLWVLCEERYTQIESPIEQDSAQIKSTMERDSAQIKSTTDQIESTTEQDSTQIESETDQIESTTEQDSTQIESETEQDSTQIESETEQDSTQIESETEQDSTQIESETEQDSTQIESETDQIESTTEQDSTQIESETEQDSTQIESTTDQIESTTEQDSTQIESETEEPSYKHLWVLCEECYTLNYKRFLKERLYICEGCESHLIMNSSERIELLIDPNTWDPMNEKMASMDPIKWDFEEDPTESDSEEDPIKWDSEEDPTESDSEEDPIQWDSEEDPTEWDSEEDPTEWDSEEDPIESDSEEAPIESDSEENPIEPDSEEAPIESDSEENPIEPGIKEQEIEENPLERETKEWDSEEAPIQLYSEENPLERETKEWDSEEAPIQLYSEENPLEFELDFEDEPYIDKKDSSQKKTGLTEAIQTGIGQLNGIPVAMGVMEFEFMGGSMGSVVGEKITRLIEYATNQSLPLIIVCASGGARMQEGSLSLMQMAKISSALYHFQTNQKLFYVSILTSPTTGGVTASFGMLGDIIVAEPNAYIAFAGKRVIEETLNKEVPEGSQETEYLFDKGLFDLVVPRNTLKSVLNELFQFHGFFPLNQNSIE